MKKYLIAAALILTVNFAQAIRIIRGSNECGIITVVYTNGDVKELGSICGGDDTYETGENEVSCIVVNGTTCQPNEVTLVILDGNVEAEVTSYTSEEDGLVFVINSVQ